MAGISGSPKNSPVDVGLLRLEPRGNVKAVPVAVDGVPDQELAPRRVVDEREAMAASEDHEPVVALVELQEEAFARDEVGRVRSGHEADVAKVSVEKAEQGRVSAVVEADAAGEAGVGDEAAPAVADKGGAREGGRLRGQAEKDLREQIVDI